MPNRNRKTIGFKLSLMFLVAAFVLCVVISVFSYFSSWNVYSDFYAKKAQEISRLGATYVDGDRIGEYLKTGGTDAYYDALMAKFEDLKRETGVYYLYMFEPALDHFTYILDARIESDDPDMINAMGDVYVYSETELTYLVPDIEAGTASDEKVFTYDDAPGGYGNAVAAWAPVFNSKGELVAMVEADISLEMVLSLLRSYMVRSILIYCAVTLVLMLILMFMNRRMVTLPIERLTRNALSFASGNALTAFVDDVHTDDEIETLSEAFCKMADDINEYTRTQAAVIADKERIATELNVATDIQHSMLPRSFPAFPGRDEFSVYALMQPAKEVGGDLYDFFLIDPTHLCVVVADVSQKGIPAALFMVVAKTMIKNQLMTGMPVQEAMTVLNTRLYEASSANVSVEAFVGVLDTETGEFAYVNAGIEDPMMMRNGGSFEAVGAQKASPLAESENVTYRRMALTLRQGDRLLLCTDGVVNAVNADGAAYGAERFRAALNSQKARAGGIDGLLKHILGEVDVFADGRERSDDITMLALEYARGDRAQAETAIAPKSAGIPAAQAFLKRKLTENNLFGAFYANLAVTVEELMVLLIDRAAPVGDITMQFSMNAEPGSVRLRFTYRGSEADPFAAAAPADLDAVAFIRRSVDQAAYAFQGGNNVVTLTKAYG